VINTNEPAQLLINTMGQNNNWIGFAVFADRYNRRAIGAVVEVHQTDGRKQIRRVSTDGSYAVANDPRTLFGLASDASDLNVKVYWLDGKVSEFHNLQSNSYYKLSRSRPDAIQL
jgi:hypothetical protein